MKHRSLVRLLVVSLCLGTSACEKQSQPGKLSWQPAPFQDAIPAEYGRLVSVTTTELQPGSALLWFEAPEQVRIVFVSYSRGQVGGTVVSIPRR